MLSGGLTQLFDPRGMEEIGSSGLQCSRIAGAHTTTGGGHVPALRYSVAQSLDGYIAGPNGEYDWIVADPEIDFPAMYAGVSGLIMGRRSYEVFVATGGAPGLALPTYVCSRSLPEGERNGVTFVGDAVTFVRTLKERDGSRGSLRVPDGVSAKPLWLWGGGDLFRELAGADLVDAVEVAVIPVLIGGGLPLLAVPGPLLPLRLRSHRVYTASGIVMLGYDVQREPR
jgi:dihydrofolate reductase